MLTWNATTLEQRFKATDEGRAFFPNCYSGVGYILQADDERRLRRFLQVWDGWRYGVLLAVSTLIVVGTDGMTILGRFMPATPRDDAELKGIVTLLAFYLVNEIIITVFLSRFPRARQSMSLGELMQRRAADSVGPMPYIMFALLAFLAILSRVSLVAP